MLQLSKLLKLIEENILIYGITNVASVMDSSEKKVIQWTKGNSLDELNRNYKAYGQALKSLPAIDDFQQLLRQAVQIRGVKNVAAAIDVEPKIVDHWNNSEKIKKLFPEHRKYTKSLNDLLPKTLPHYGDSLEQLLERAVAIWDQGYVAEAIGVERETVNRWRKNKNLDELNKNSEQYTKSLLSILPSKPKDYGSRKFTFIDLFAGIGGLRLAFEGIGGKCVFTSEWDDYARRTYMANHYDDHTLNSNIKDITEGILLSQATGIPAQELTEEEIDQDIGVRIADHDVLLAGFPCQPFSIAGVSKKNSLGRVHGFDCKIQGTLFFDICKVLKVKQPACFMLENVKNLRSHNKGDTYQSILEALDAAGYDVPEPRVINAKEFLPQNRERIVIVGFRKDLEIGQDFDFNKIKPRKNEAIETLGALLTPSSDIDKKYTLTPNLWNYLQAYKAKHRGNGNGFGYDIFTPKSTYTRTLSARYYKDGSEILIAKNEKHVVDCEAGASIPRRLTPRECARLMGFEKPGEEKLKIPVSDTRAYKQFGNSVVVPVFKAVAKQMKKHIIDGVEKQQLHSKTKAEVKPKKALA